jgi:uncharacterized membrane protein YoaK (UPF0700 family)
MVDHPKPSLPLLLSFNGGYVDTAGFLALQGLFTAHVTGNFVTLGAALALGTSGVVSKLLALPVFCLVIFITRFASLGFSRSESVLPAMLTLKLSLLVVGAVLALTLGPFANGDSGPAVLTGMILVAAMAIQNAAHRIHLGTSPPSTLMTGTTTQLMIDLADLARGVPEPQRAVTRTRLRHLGSAIVAFALGAGIAAILFTTVHMGCFVVPPLVSLGARLVATHGVSRG